MADNLTGTFNNMPLMPSSLENVDVGFYEYIDEKFDIRARTNSGIIKVPLLWLSAERTHQIKNNKEIRDAAGRLKLPLISIERTSVVKDPSFKGAFQADFKSSMHKSRSYRDGTIVIASRIVEEKSRNIAAADTKKSEFGDVNRTTVVKRQAGDETVSTEQEWFPRQNKKIVYEEVLVPIPTYVAITYTIVLRSEYQQQMNDMLTPFITNTGNLNYFVFEKNNYNYEAFIDQDFSQENNSSSLNEDERAFTTKITIKVLGQLVGDENHSPTPKVVKKENFVELKISRERVMLGDEIPWKTKDKKYRG